MRVHIGILNREIEEKNEMNSENDEEIDVKYRSNQLKKLQQDLKLKKYKLKLFKKLKEKEDKTLEEQKVFIDKISTMFSISADAGSLDDV